MLLLLITIILSMLKYFNVITWSWWIVMAPVILLGAYSYWLFIRTEIGYLREYNKENKE